MRDRAGSPALLRATRLLRIRHALMAAALALAPSISSADEDAGEFAPLSEVERTRLMSALQHDADRLGLDLSTLEGTRSRRKDAARATAPWTAEAFVYTPIVHDKAGLCSRLDYRYERKEPGDWRQARPPLDIAWLDKAGVCEPQHSSEWTVLIGDRPASALVVRVLRDKDALLEQALALPVHEQCAGAITTSARLASIRSTVAEWPRGVAPGMVTLTFRAFRELGEPALHVLTSADGEQSIAHATRCWVPD